MGKFIDRQKLEAHFSPAITGKEAYTAGEVLLSIQKFPSADVVPVVHAHWKFGKCTKCGGDAPFWCMASTYRASSYCPDCGAKMDEEVEDAKIY